MTDQTSPRRLVRISEARRRHPELSPYVIREMVAKGVVSGFRPTGARLLLIDEQDLDRAVMESRVVPEAAR